MVLIENLEENLDPVLGPLLGRETIKKGRYVPVICVVSLHWVPTLTAMCMENTAGFIISFTYSNDLVVYGNHE